MSIIQDALKKAQGDFTGKKMPQEKRHVEHGENVIKSEPLASAPIQHVQKEHRIHLSMRLPALVSILVVLLLAYGFKLSMQYSRTHDNTVIETKITSPAAVDKKQEADSGMFAQAKKLNPISFMDPRRNLYVLSGIMYVEGKPQAIINSQVLEEGDKISGATILAIEKDCVLLDLNDASIRLDLKQD